MCFDRGDENPGDFRTFWEFAMVWEIGNLLGFWESSEVFGI